MSKILLLLLLALMPVFGLHASENPVILQSFYWYIPDANTENEIPESNMWNYIADEMAPQFKEDGFSHIWLPPTGKAFSPVGQGHNVGYAVYDHYDLGEFHQMGHIRTKYGTKKELHRAVDALHDNGLKVIADIVMNHILGAYRSSPIPYSYAFKHHENDYIEVFYNGYVNAFVDFDFNKPNDPAPRNGVYSDFVWSAEHFDGLESYSNSYLFEGKQVDKVIDLGDLTSLPHYEQELYKKLRSDVILGIDYDLQHPEVQSEMLTWSKWLVDEVGFDGFRVDALRHLHIPFVTRWADEMRDHMKSIGKEDGLQMFGEFWDGWADRLNAFLTGNPEGNDLLYSHRRPSRDYAGIAESMDLFDVPLHFDFQKVAKQNNSFPITRMIDLPDRGLLAKNPTKAVTFVDNHDTVPTQELASYIPLHTKIQAYTFILLHQYGTPTVFYRDMYKGNFISQFENNAKDYLNYHLKSLLKLRKNYAYGHGRFYRNYSRPGILGYKRDGDRKHKGSGLIYLIREYDSWDNGIKMPTDGGEWKLALGDGSLHNGTFYLNNDSDFAVWVRK